MNKGVLKRYLANSAIAVTVFVAVLIFVASFFPLARLHDFVYHYVEISRFVKRLISLLLLFITWHLYLRKRLAWMLSVVLLSVSLFLFFVFHHHLVNLIIVVCQTYALAAFLICHRDFKRPSNRLSLKRSALLAVFAMIVVLANAALGRVRLSDNVGEPLSFVESMADTFGIVFGVRDYFSVYDWFVLCFVWFCVIACVVLILHSAIITRKTTVEEKARARALVLKYGMNSNSYLTLEDDKILFFGAKVDGVIPYGVVGNIVTVLGDPICAPDDFLCLIKEFQAFCAECSYQPVFLSTRPTFIGQYAALGYSHVKSGEEALFHLTDYNLAGGKMQKLRALINHANKEVTTHEYKPNEQRDEAIEQGIAAVSDEWLEGKKSSLLRFTVGGVGLDDPLDRRYFYAMDGAGKIVAFNVYLPYANGKGYMADVTRRLNGAPGGVTEKIMFDAFMTFKSEGVEWGSMGPSPLVNVREDGTRDDMASKLLEFIYEKCNRFYGFKDLHRAKEKYSPTEWEPGYIVYPGKIITPDIAYAIVKIKNPGGVTDFLMSSAKAHFRK